jgi:hypothetical protein
MWWREVIEGKNVKSSKTPWSKLEWREPVEVKKKRLTVQTGDKNRGFVRGRKFDARLERNR